MLVEKSSPCFRRHLYLISDPQQFISLGIDRHSANASLKSSLQLMQPFAFFSVEKAFKIPSRQTLSIFFTELILLKWMHCCSKVAAGPSAVARVQWIPLWNAWYLFRYWNRIMDSSNPKEIDHLFSGST
jgi:hypothetical protein